MKTSSKVYIILGAISAIGTIVLISCVVQESGKSPEKLIKDGKKFVKKSSKKAEKLLNKTKKPLKKKRIPL